MLPSFGVLICPNFRNPEKSAHKLALRFESSTFEDPILDHFLDTFFEHFPKKWRFAPPARGLLSSRLGGYFLGCRPKKITGPDMFQQFPN